MINLVTRLYFSFLEEQTEFDACSKSKNHSVLTLSCIISKCQMYRHVFFNSNQFPLLDNNLKLEHVYSDRMYLNVPKFSISFCIFCIFFKSNYLFSFKLFKKRVRRVNTIKRILLLLF